LDASEDAGTPVVDPRLKVKPLHAQLDGVLVRLRLIAVRLLELLFKGLAFAAERQPCALQLGLVRSKSGQGLVLCGELVRKGSMSDGRLLLTHALLVGKVGQVGAVVGENGPFNVSCDARGQLREGHDSVHGTGALQIDEFSNDSAQLIVDHLGGSLVGVVADGRRVVRSLCRLSTQQKGCQANKLLIEDALRRRL